MLISSLIKELICHFTFEWERGKSGEREKRRKGDKNHSPLPLISPSPYPPPHKRIIT